MISAALQWLGSSGGNWIALSEGAFAKESSLLRSALMTGGDLDLEMKITTAALLSYSFVASYFFLKRIVSGCRSPAPLSIVLLAVLGTIACDGRNSECMSTRVASSLVADISFLTISFHISRCIFGVLRAIFSSCFGATSASRCVGLKSAAFASTNLWLWATVNAGADPSSMVKNLGRDTSFSHLTFATVFASSLAALGFICEPWSPFAAYRKPTLKVVGTSKGLSQNVKTAKDVDAVVADMRECFNAGVSRDVQRRKEALLALRKMVAENEDALVQATMKDLRRPKFETLVYETRLVIQEIDHMLLHIDDYVKPKFQRPYLLTIPSSQMLLPEPYGVVLIIGTWNYPIMLSLAPLVGAIAAGNTVVLKPCNVSAACAKLLNELVPKYLPKDLVSVVGAGFKGDRECNGILLKNKFDKICFTGSPDVGRVVARAAAEHLAPCILELGGKNPVYVDESADVNLAAKRVVWARNFNAGQQCISPDFVLCHQGVIEEFCAACKEWAGKLYGGDPKESPDIGRIVGDKQFTRIKDLLDESKNSPNCEVVCGGMYDADDRYIAPTVLRVTGPGVPLMKDEVFGPVLLVNEVATMGDAIAEINRRPKPLAMYAFMNDSAKEDEFLQRTSAGGVTINSCLWHALMLPFGGVGNSGTGAYHGKASFDSFSHDKPCLRKLWINDLGLLSDPFLIYPPFSRVKEQVITALMKFNHY